MKINDGLLKDHIPVIAGVSGGADSVCLFVVLEDLAEKLDFPLYVCHVEHGIRGEASLADRDYVRGLCESRGIPFYCESVDAVRYSKDRGLSVEEGARMLRRRAYMNAAEHFAPGSEVYIALAHHAEDNAETILLNMIRGSGAKGLAGMEYCASISPEAMKLKVIRPLLNVTRAEIEDELVSRKIDWRTDDTNADNAYTRNRIRNEIMPMLCEINPRAVEHINSSGAAVRELLTPQENRAWELYEAALTSNGLEVSILLCASRELRRGAVEIMLDKNGGVKDVGRKHYEGLEDLMTGRSGRGIDLPGGRRMELNYGILELKRNVAYGGQDSVMEPVMLQKPSPGEDIFYDFDRFTIKLSAFEASERADYPKKSYAKWFDYDKIDSIILRNRREGDFLVIDRKGGRKSLRRLFIDSKTPRDERDSLPVLAEGDSGSVIWAVGIRESMAYHLTPESRMILEIKMEL